jgi:hypothetical protein
MVQLSSYIAEWYWSFIDGHSREDGARHARPPSIPDLKTRWRPAERTALVEDPQSAAL